MREYFARQLREQRPEAWRAAHRRLYRAPLHDNMKGPSPHSKTCNPSTRPFPTVATRGCSRSSDKVFRDRIQRGREDYSTKKLGAFGSNLGAVACFFEPPWSRVSPALTEADQAWLLNEAAFSLRALGRLTEALEPMRAGLEMRVKQEDWRERRHRRQQPE